MRGVAEQDGAIAEEGVRLALRDETHAVFVLRDGDHFRDHTQGCDLLAHPRLGSRSAVHGEGLIGEPCVHRRAPRRPGVRDLTVQHAHQPRRGVLVDERSHAGHVDRNGKRNPLALGQRRGRWSAEEIHLPARHGLVRGIGRGCHEPRVEVLDTETGPQHSRDVTAHLDQIAGGPRISRGRERRLTGHIPDVDGPLGLDALERLRAPDNRDQQGKEEKQPAHDEYLEVVHAVAIAGRGSIGLTGKD